MFNLTTPKNHNGKRRDDRATCDKILQHSKNKRKLGNQNIFGIKTSEIVLSASNSVQFKNKNENFTNFAFHRRTVI